MLMCFTVSVNKDLQIESGDTDPDRNTDTHRITVCYCVIIDVLIRAALQRMIIIIIGRSGDHVPD